MGRDTFEQSEMSSIVFGGKSAFGFDETVPLSLSYRMAFVLMLDESSDDSYACMEQMVRELILAVAQAVDCDSINCSDMENEISCPFHEYWDKKLDKSGLHIPSEIEITKCKTAQIVMKCELWVCVGGPYPYHDSYTYSTYVKDAAAGSKVMDAVLRWYRTTGQPDPPVIYEE